MSHNHRCGIFVRCKTVPRGDWNGRSWPGVSCYVEPRHVFFVWVDRVFALRLVGSDYQQECSFFKNPLISPTFPGPLHQHCGWSGGSNCTFALHVNYPRSHAESKPSLAWLTRRFGHLWTFAMRPWTCRRRVENREQKWKHLKFFFGCTNQWGFAGNWSQRSYLARLKWGKMIQRDGDHFGLCM